MNLSKCLTGVLTLVSAVVLLCATAVCADAFHDGGVGSCTGCHVEHEAPGGATQWLLRGGDASSVCLSCHAGPGGGSSPSVYSFDGSARTPGGDFYWLTKTFTWTGGASPAETHGHNVVARDFNLLQDPLRSHSPGGTYPSAQLSCVSCHDPHGKVLGGTAAGRGPVSVSGSYGETAPPNSIRGNYRLLGDSNYDGGVAGYSFAYNAPIARQSSLIPFGESDASHVDYGSGMSEWCANCHFDVLKNEHGSSGSEFRHPAGNVEQLPDNYITQYEQYVSTGNLSGTAATSYLQFVPFERNSSDPQNLNPVSSQGPNATSNVMCLTCHRAHGSAFRVAGRWDPDAALLVDSHPASGDGGVTGNDVANSYYGRSIGTEFGGNQKQFCEKCHDDNP
jgi:predicted CXXCH cytochrome family protein